MWIIYYNTIKYNFFLKKIDDVKDKSNSPTLKIIKNNVNLIASLLKVSDREFQILEPWYVNEFMFGYLWRGYN